MNKKKDVDINKKDADINKRDVDIDKKDVDIEKLMQDVEIRSEVVQEIMGYIPHWIIRWGITVIFAVIFFIILGSYFFRYPDIIPSRIILTTKNPPSTLVAKTSGKISELFVKDRQKVQEKDKIAIIENPANHNHLFELKEKLESLRSSFNYFENPFPFVEFDKNYSLGQLKSYYARFLSSYEAYQNFLKRDFYRKSIDSIKDQIEVSKILKKQQERKIELSKKERENSLKSYERSKALRKDGIIPESDLEKAELSYLTKKNAYEDAKASLKRIESDILRLEQQIWSLERNQKDDKERLEVSLSQNYEDLCQQIDQWEHTYLLKADISGVVTFTKYWSVNQNVTAGEKVVTIVPEKGGKIIGKLQLPVQGSGKVKVGQRLNIKFDNFPHMDYGMVEGVITSKSLIASDDFYSLEVELPNGLVTSYNKELEFSQEMQGTAEIVTEDIRLLERIFKPIKNILKKMEEKEEQQQ
ncbi:MAG: HlyD family efflux transporter periplasmic adaptor subunit [Candidatus Aminicenantes bacterium]|nr:HlyD family efflux transporter periplasmic adaptor subunit [Candidatus Aminicenantes bacterium]NIM79435.1 HlyD family efflux transporter periplasmic adaptor subunit [Candidatus Aminicenantes bacterium]NIN18717.1 HlyD family efflux transporter periplasmic adaptor subunit [Candidatus Aminicenantes bacterium]NIN42641.1 HlyD family efflux transporter periplasmic adaptor subunit [Candidatus Aminicenantes bacterium]NIN85380.1 HlyD family efflux transporter periplasmic adaptor subunit [Candidatus A